jgi:ACS family tartrate transporter-like MFS transporter
MPTLTSVRAVIIAKAVQPATIGWIKDLTGSFLGGLYFVAGLLVISALLTLLLARSLQRPQPEAVAAHS